MAKHESYKRLYRSRTDKYIAGVCGGIAEYWRVDPVWIRLIAVLLIFASGIGIILYVVAWIIVPKNPQQKSTPETRAEKVADKFIKKSKDKKRVDASFILGTLIVLIGVGLFFKALFSWFNFTIIWAIILILIGAFIVMRRSQ
jgi:phage shock protein C